MLQYAYGAIGNTQRNINSSHGMGLVALAPAIGSFVGTTVIYFLKLKWAILFPACCFVFTYLLIFIPLLEL